MGHTFGLGDNRLGGMFESYLADSPNTSEDALEYRATIDSILKAVSPYTKNVSVPQKIRDGFSSSTESSHLLRRWPHLRLLIKRHLCSDVI